MPSLRLKNHEQTPVRKDDSPKGVWTWAGHYFGYWEGRDLWSYQGRHVGRRRGFEIFSPTGRYIGELMSNNRLAVNKAKVAQLGASFIPYAPREPQQPEADRDSFSMYTGFDDFHHPDQF